MKLKTIYLATDNKQDDFNEIAFESEVDIIEFCKKENNKGNNWGWHPITYYYN